MRWETVEHASAAMEEYMQDGIVHPRGMARDGVAAIADVRGGIGVVNVAMHGVILAAWRAGLVSESHPSVVAVLIDTGVA